MPRQSVENRFERLERRVTGIEQLPARMDRLELQIVQLRAEMRDEFSAIRREIQAGEEGSLRSLREEIRNGNVMIVTAVAAQVEDARAESRSLFDDARAESRSLFEDARTESRSLFEDARTESRSLFEDARRENRVLFEEALARIANIQEGLGSTRRTKKR